MIYFFLKFFSVRVINNSLIKNVFIHIFTRVTNVSVCIVCLNYISLSNNIFCLCHLELPLFLGHNFLGRDPNFCTIQLLAPSVSKQHAAISISVHRRRGRVHEVDMEALVWDQKSTNGTHKGRLKLTPNVRYALNEGDNLVLGDIPCRYVSSGMDSPSSLGDMETPRQSEANARLSDWDDVDTGSKKCVSSGTKAKKIPVTGSCLSFEKTPVQPQGSLVPESDSESESEREGRGNRKQKDVGM